LPVTICAFGDWFAIVFRRSRSTFAYQDNAFRLAAPERLTQVGFSLLENTLLVPGQIFPSAVDVKIQRRHR
jgi:hypothetical protein